VIIGPGKGMREEEQSTEGGGEETWRVKNMHGSVVERSGWRFNKNFGHIKLTHLIHKLLLLGSSKERIDEREKRPQPGLN
jgi:hypothetical protein